MKTILLVLVTFVSSYGVSQTQTQTLKRWKIGVLTSFDHSFEENQNFGCGTGILPGGCYVQPYYSKFDFTTGIVGQYAFTPKLEIGTGISYSRKMRRYFEHILIAPGQNGCLEIPVFVRYNFLKTKLNFHVEGGGVAQMVLEKYHYGSKFALNTQLGLGMSYTFGDFLNVSGTTFYERRVLNFERTYSIFSPNSISFELRAAYIF